MHEEFDPGVESAHKNYKLLYTQRDKFLAPLESGFKTCKSKSQAFFAEEEEKRRIEQEKIDAKAKKEQDDRKAELEKQKQGWVDKAKICRKQADEYYKRGMMANAESSTREAERYEEKAGQRQEKKEQVHTPTAIVQSGAEKQQGFSNRDNWKAEVIDEAAFYKAVLEGKVPRSCIQPNQSRINSFAKDVKIAKTENGLRFYNEIVSSLRV